MNNENATKNAFALAFNTEFVTIENGDVTETDEKSNVNTFRNERILNVYFRSAPKWTVSVHECGSQQSIFKASSLLLRFRYLKPTLKIKFNDLQCVSKVSRYRESGYWFNFGLIGIPKQSANAWTHIKSHVTSNNHHMSFPNLCKFVKNQLWQDYECLYLYCFCDKNNKNDTTYYSCIRQNNLYIQLSVSFKENDVLSMQYDSKTDTVMFLKNNKVIQDHTIHVKVKSNNDNNNNLTDEKDSGDSNDNDHDSDIDIDSDMNDKDKEFNNLLEKYLAKHENNKQKNIFDKNGAIKIDTSVNQYGYVLSSMGCDCSDFGNVSFEISYQKIEWEVERLVWIGYLKNDDNDDCFVSQLSKDLVCFILSYF